MLDAEFWERVQEELEQEVLPNYRKTVDEYNSVVNTYQGVFTKDEYKKLLGVLHTDRYPDIDDVLKRRMEEMFDLVTRKKFELCGPDVKRENTLPKTVADMMAMRKTKR